MQLYILFFLEKRGRKPKPIQIIETVYEEDIESGNEGDESANLEDAAKDESTNETETDDTVATGEEKRKISDLLETVGLIDVHDSGKVS